MKKAQNEMIGFVVIVLLVVVIGVVFLGILLRKSERVAGRDAEISSFLESSMKYTSNCALSYEPDYDTLQDLITDCYKGRKCIDGNHSCDVLNSSYSVILEKTWLVGEARPVKAYSFNVSFYSSYDNSSKEGILYLEKGIFEECSAERGSEYIQAAYEGVVHTEMSVCYQEY